MTTPSTLESSSNFTINPTDPPQHISAIVPLSCIAIAMTVFISLGYAYYKDLYIPKSDAYPVETADFDFQSRDYMGRRASVVYAQMVLWRVRQGLHNAFHFMGESILSTGAAITNSTANWWKRKTRNEDETNTFYMGVNQFTNQRADEEQLLI